MPKSNIELWTNTGELVTEFQLARRLRVAPFRLWSIIKCMDKEELQNCDLPKGVEAEVALCLVFHSHESMRTTEIARLLGRDVATVCRSLSRLAQKGWIVHVSRGTWQVSSKLVHHGKWKRVSQNGE